MYAIISEFFQFIFISSAICLKFFSNFYLQLILLIIFFFILLFCSKYLLSSSFFSFPNSGESFFFPVFHQYFLRSVLRAELLWFCFVLFFSVKGFLPFLFHFLKSNQFCLFCYVFKILPLNTLLDTTRTIHISKTKS